MKFKEHKQLTGSTITACPGCDLLLEKHYIPKDMATCCPRCGFRLYSGREPNLDNIMAISLTGLILYLPSITLPLLTLEALGLKRSGSILDSMLVLFRSGFYFVAIMVFLTALFFPLVKFIFMFTVACVLKFRLRCGCLPRLFRAYLHVEEWGMAEVYMIGVLVTVIKMYNMASIEYNTGFFCFTVFMLAAVMLSICMDRQRLWEMVEDAGASLSRTGIDLSPCLKNVKKLQNTTSPCAMSVGIAVCHDCNNAVCLRDGFHRMKHDTLCPRCGASLHFRRPSSVEDTWAFLITAIILFFPANFLPMMKVEYLGVPEYSTIMDGIIYFFEEGEYGIGAVILTASVLVPLFKITGIIMILLSIHFKWKSWLRHKALMFRFIEFVGRWSMLDVFVVALLQAIVNFGFMTSIEAASGASYFSGVVIMTMFAAISIDPRMLWDSSGQCKE